MTYRDKEKQKAIRLRADIFRDPGNGLFFGKEREFVLRIRHLTCGKVSGKTLLSISKEMQSLVGEAMSMNRRDIYCRLLFAVLKKRLPYALMFRNICEEKSRKFTNQDTLGMVELVKKMKQLID